MLCLNQEYLQNKEEIIQDSVTVKFENISANGMDLLIVGYINETDTQIFYYDKLFEDLLSEGNSYKDLVQIIHYIIPRVVNRKFKDDDGNDINNKYGYFKNAIISNINKLNYEYEDLWGEDEYDWLNDDLER